MYNSHKTKIGTVTDCYQVWSKTSACLCYLTLLYGIKEIVTC